MIENEELARLLGHLPDGTPIWQQVGGAPDDDETEDEDDDEKDEDDEEEEWTPPTREEWETQQRRLNRANKESAKRRKLLKSKASDEDEEDADDDDDEADKGGKGTDRKELKRLLARAETRAEARAEAKYKPALVKQAARSALVEAGFSGEVSARTMGLLNLDELDVDEDGEILGLDEAIEELKEDLPQLFKRSRNTSGTKGGTGRKLDGGNKREAKAAKSYLDLVSEQLG